MRILRYSDDERPGRDAQAEPDTNPNYKGIFMRSILLGLLAASALFAAAPAFAQDTDPPAAVTVSGSATVTSDYRFRGVSQTDKDFAVQGGITVTHQSGLYGSLWGSTIDDYVAGGADQEIDLTLGYKKDLGGTTLDVGAVYYVYPGAEKITPGLDTDFIETYAALSHTLGPVNAKASIAYAPKQSALSVGHGKEDNLYLAADLSVGIPTTPVTVNAHVGHSIGPSYLTIGKSYTDWSVGATYVWKSLSFGVTYVDTDKALYTPSGKNIAKAGVFGTVGVSF